MGCARIGDLRAFLDGELARGDASRLQQHLGSCLSCRRELEVLSENAARVGSALSCLSSGASGVPQASWSRIRDRVEREGRGPVTIWSGVSTMFRGLLDFAGGRGVRIAAGVAAALAMVVLLFSLSPVQTAASSFLSIFRVKKFVAVTVDPSSLPDFASPSDLGNFTITGDRTYREVTPAEAERMVGFKIVTPGTLPSGLEAKPRSVAAAGGYSVTFVPDLKKVRAYLSSIGATNVKLPDNLDGAPISLQVPPSVALLYAERGSVDRSPDGTVKPAVGQRFLYLGAATSPTMNVPDGLDVEGIRSEILKVPGLPPDLVNQLKAIEDWRNTVVVPVVKGTSREVTVQGEKGVLISEASGHGTTVLWSKGGLVFTITGNVSEAEILAAANSLR